MSNVNTSEILAAMQCPICLDVLRPPIQVCLNGHGLCNDCHEKLEQEPQTLFASCPTCREDFNLESCHLLEIIYDRLEVSCKNGVHGCTVTGYGSDVRMHEEECAYRRKKCPKCPWEGRQTSLVEHYIEDHVEESMDQIRRCPRCAWQGLQTSLTKHYVENHV